MMKDIVKSYESGGEEQTVLDHVNFRLKRGVCLHFRAIRIRQIHHDEHYRMS